MTFKLGIQHRVLKYDPVCSNGDTGLTLTIFMTWSNFSSNASAWEKAYTAYSHVFIQSNYPMHSSERYRTNGPLVFSITIGFAKICALYLNARHFWKIFHLVF